MLDSDARAGHSTGLILNSRQLSNAAVPIMDDLQATSYARIINLANYRNKWIEAFLFPKK